MNKEYKNDTEVQIKVACMNCKNVWIKYGGDYSVCPKCGCNAYVPVDINKESQDKNQKLLFD